MSDRPPMSRDQLEKATNQVESTADSNWRTIRWIYPVLFILTILIAGQLIITRRQADTVDNLNIKVTRIDAQADKIGAYVDDLKAPPSAEEARRNAAVSQAIAEVPRIKSILCEQFPQASACRQ